MNPDLPTIAAFWVGPYLSWMEQMGLLSFVRHGHKVILYTRGEVKNIPDGIEVRPASEVWDVDKVKVFRSVKTVTLHPIVINSDFFRWHLQAKTDYIYTDADHFCLKPISMFSRQELVQKGFLVGPQFFRFPENSPTVKLALKLLSQKHPIPGWFPFKERMCLRLRKLTGRGVPITNMPWGSAGGHLLKWARKQTGEEVNKFKSVRFIVRNENDLQMILGSPAEFKSCLRETHHLVLIGWPKIYRYNKEFLTHPPENSWMAEQARALGVNPPDAPVLETRHKNREYVAAINNDDSILL